jgi:guanylate kinase
MEFFDALCFSISYTTRKIRPGEADGVDYCFVNQETFDLMVDKGEFLEHASVHGRSYGTAEKDIKDMLRGGRDALLDIDVQGAEQLLKKFPDALYVFILPPSMEVCRERLVRRGDIDSDEIDRRVAAAEGEMKRIELYGHTIVNDDIDEAFAELRSTIEEARGVKGGRKSCSRV